MEDIASDLSVFHRIDDWEEMDGPTYFARAVRLPAYDGVMRGVLMAELNDQKEGRTMASGPIDHPLADEFSGLVCSPDGMASSPGVMEGNLATAGVVDWGRG